MDIRVSCGSEGKLGLRRIREGAPTEIVYLMTRGICHASCDFCTQSREYESKKLSRVSWNVWDFEHILPMLNNQKRVCIQCLNYPEVYDDLLEMVKRIKCPVSVSAQPFGLDEMHKLSKYVEKISISLDCFTKEIFNRYKSFYDWELHWARLRKAVDIFGEGNVVSHLIVGLGETEKESIDTLYDLVDIGVIPSLFAFTPMKETKLANNQPPDLGHYRRVQIARHLISKGALAQEDITYDGGKISSFCCSLDELTTDAFTTQGCPDCNRPYYNETPGETMYNYPKKIPDGELCRLIAEAGLRVE